MVTVAEGMRIQQVAGRVAYGHGETVRTVEGAGRALVEFRRLVRTPYPPRGEFFALVRQLRQYPRRMVVALAKLV
jgi:hypothetical protein